MLMMQNTHARNHVVYDIDFVMTVDYENYHEYYYYHYPINHTVRYIILYYISMTTFVSTHIS